jgi:hypothetical protein
MLQIDHVYEFLYQELFKEFEFWHLFGGVTQSTNINITDISIFTQRADLDKKIFFYDQEPFIKPIAGSYMDIFTWESQYTIEELLDKNKNNDLPYNIKSIEDDELAVFLTNLNYVYKQGILVTSEYSEDVNNCLSNNNLKSLYYFFHGFAALDWYRGFYALNYNKQVIKEYKYDYVSFNRIVTDDRSYRIYFISQLVEQGLLKHGQVSFNVTDALFDEWRDETSNPKTKLSQSAVSHAEEYLTNITKLVIDQHSMPGSASADIPRCTNDSFWHIVTETVFYYDKLHLTEKIFKPIVMKQPFMLLAAPGNLAYLKSYGFKTFEGIIDESYDTIVDNDQRIEAVVRQIAWYCALSVEEKQQVIEAIAPIVEYNFHHFYGEFKHIISKELLDNCKNLFKDLGYNDSNINYDTIYKTLVN